MPAIPVGKRIIEISIAFALIYTAIVWIAFGLLSGTSSPNTLYSAIQWWLPGILLLIGVTSLLTQFLERRTKLIFGLLSSYLGVILFISIGYGAYLNLIFGFIVGSLLVIGLTILLIRPSTLTCPHCGAINPEKHDFCAKCGNRLKP